MKGWAIGTVVSLAAVFAAGCEYSELNGIGTRTSDEDHPPQLDLASFDGCEPGDLNRVRAVGYEIVVAVTDAEGVRLDQKSTWVRDLRPGERAAIDHSWWIDGRDDVDGCEVLVINRWG